MRLSNIGDFTMPETISCSEPIQQTVSTGIENGTLASDSREADAHREGWQRIIDEYLVEWGRNPAFLNDDEIVAPSLSVISYACQIAVDLRDAEPPPPSPSRAVPDGEGGIAFERRVGDCFQSLEIREDRTIELVTFRNCKIVSRVMLA